MAQSTALKEFVGVVTEIIPQFKAIVQFHLDNKTERALLRYDKLRVDGEPLPEGGSIDDHIKRFTQLKFLCHPLDDSGIDRCGWYITCAWEHNTRETELQSNETIVKGLYNCKGDVLEVARRQGILTYNNKGKEELVMFLGSKVFLGGRRVTAKANLCQQAGLEEGCTLSFDAVPCDPVANDSQCGWFATIVWKGRKPQMEYDDTRSVRNQKNVKLPVPTEMKLLTSNPHSMFFRGEGQVMKILNAEYGILLGKISNNHYETVLFHRSQAMLFDLSLTDVDLTTVFKEEDMMRIVAAMSPKKFGTKWVASQVRVYVDPSIAHEFQF